jgi:hypothetical protein
MRRFRTQWLALFGALAILSLSLSSAFGARPPVASDDETTNVGRQVSSFVHSLVSGEEDEEDGDQDETGECDTDSDEDGAEDGDSDEDGAEDSDEAGADGGDEDSEGDETVEGDEDPVDGDEIPADETGNDCEGTEDEDSDQGTEDEGSEDQETQNHGSCVADVAQGDETGDNGTHGWAVSLAARVTCLLEQLADETGDEDSGASDDAAADTDASSAKPHGKSEDAHQRKADHASGKPSWAGAKLHDAANGHGNGHGKGGNH